MSFLSTLKSRLSAFIHDTIMVPLALLLAFWLRFNLEAIPEQNLKAAILSLIVILPIQIVAFWQFGLYRGIWRFASIPDLLRIFKAVIFGVCFSVLILFAINRLEGMPRSVPLLYAISLSLMLSGPRLLYRWFKDHRLYIKTGQRVLIVGAGRAGEMLARDLMRDPHSSYQPIAFVDDDKRKKSKDIHGIAVQGVISDIPSIVKRLQIDIILIAIPSAKSGQMRLIMQYCEEAEKPVRTLPRFVDIVSGHVNLDSLRSVSIEDLLGRDPVSLDKQSLDAGLKGKCVLVTGAGGSIGSELCRQIAKRDPDKLILLDHSEYNLYKIDLELEKIFPRLERKIYLDDVADVYAVENVLSADQPDIIFHAAAYKHVPMLQNQVRSAVHNNIIGTHVVANAADKFKVDTFVLISTDKAVNPTNVMGTTKRVSEMICKNLDEKSPTRYIAVRFGNVLGSAGSVVPLFKEQIRKGGPVTVTHPDITRYFMTIPEACQLIMQASVMGDGGETFVLDMGEPVRISYLAEQMITLSGKTPGEDIEIVYTGLRPGEKLFEELFYERESLIGTRIEKIMLSRYKEVLVNFNAQLKKLAKASEHNDAGKMEELLHEFVPEYSSENHSEHETNIVYIKSHEN